MNEPYLQNTIGIEGENRGVIRILSEGTPLPSAVAYIFARARTGQAFIALHVVKGNEDTIDRCSSLGVYRLFFQQKGIIEDSRLVVTFAVNAYGELFLFGKGLETRLEVRIDKK